MANVPVYNITDVPTKRAIMALMEEIDKLKSDSPKSVSINGVSVPLATDSVDGLMSAQDKAKLNGIESRAQRNPEIVDATNQYPTVYIRGGTSYTPIFGNVDLWRYGNVVHMRIANGAMPYPQFPTFQNNVEILSGMAEKYRPLASVRITGRCSVFTSSSGAGGKWALVILDVSTSGKITILDTFTPSYESVGTGFYRGSYLINASWYSNR